jgi:hypothetical protein
MSSFGTNFIINADDDEATKILKVANYFNLAVALYDKDIETVGGLVEELVSFNSATT